MGGGKGPTGPLAQRKSLRITQCPRRVASGPPQKAGHEGSWFQGFGVPKSQAPTLDCAPAAKCEAGQRRGGGESTKVRCPRKRSLHSWAARLSSIALGSESTGGRGSGLFPRLLITPGPLVGGSLRKRLRHHGTPQSPLRPQEEASCPRCAPVSIPGPATSHRTQIRRPLRSVARPRPHSLNFMIDFKFRCSFFNTNHCLVSLFFQRM
ncbi:hypothetical protein NDU88_005348 [Pleurodeles waltl]|uniref:Uncharacterized protein n=1 Tax=Pleurodeles waltl TaxID=8319 RepID=A0AAV7UKR5_PLEWA|nr:hypothetical protein NDU88_005348 [Pleurodeles waltl]